MCGFVGFICNAPGEGSAVVKKMADTIRHRGPDDGGVWVDESEGLALAHRRLAIVDLSPAGHQPMRSEDGRYVIAFNGEIYNHLDLRAELEREGCVPEWRGHSDTETLLASVCQWGVEGALVRLNGMFTFALWDIKERTLYLTRDRMGEKPLYYGRNGDAFLFGSELKALEAFPTWQAEVDRDALALFMRHGYVPTPWSIYKGIKKLPPAHYIVVRDHGKQVSEPICYWSLPELAEQASRVQAVEGVALIDELDSLLKEAIRTRMVADVPLGAFLSGGFDSTTVVALMQAQSPRPVKTFSIGFHEAGFNEAVHAKAVAKHLGTDHTELYVTPEQAMAVIPNLPLIYDEPFADSSQIPTYLVCELARRHVTVSLSGDGGDELFFGYERYFKGAQIWRKLASVPLPVRRLGAWVLGNTPSHALEKAMQILPERLRIKHLGDRLPKLAEIISQRDGTGFYRELVSSWKDPSRVVIGATEPDTIMNSPGLLPKLPSLCEQMMYLDMMTYLPDDILTKVDRASMAVSLEGRVPMLDHRVVEFAWRVPTEFKYRDNQGKWLLRQVLDRYVPRGLMDRPKMGFAVPIEQWLCGPLRDWAEALLDEARLRREGFFDPAPIRVMWQEHLCGQRRWHSCLWNVLMFQAWFESKQGHGKFLSDHD